MLTVLLTFLHHYNSKTISSLLSHLLPKPLNFPGSYSSVGGETHDITKFLWKILQWLCESHVDKLNAVFCFLWENYFSCQDSNACLFFHILNLSDFIGIYYTEREGKTPIGTRKRKSNLNMNSLFNQFTILIFFLPSWLWTSISLSTKWKYNTMKGYWNWVII